MKNEKNIYFENLDGIRFILAIMVLLGHSMFSSTLDLLLPKNKFLNAITHALSNGSQAVSFFFVLSGFLITYLLLQEKEKTNSINIKNFYIRRILRIWPLYYFVVIFGYIIYPFLKSLVGWETSISSIWILDALFLGNFNSLFVHANNLVGNHPMMIGITWSVSIEEQFYLVWPLVFLVNRKYLPYLLIFAILGSLLFIHFNPKLSYYHTLSRVLDLSIGGLFSYGIFYSTKFLSFFINLPKKFIILFYSIGLFYFIFYSIFPLFNKYQLLLCIFYAFIICEQNFSINSIFKFSTWEFGSKRGKYTYGIYMLHPIGIQIAVVLYKLLGISNTDNFIYGIVYVIISLFTSYFMAFKSFYYLEKPFLKLKKKYN